VEIIALPSRAGRLPLDLLLERLHARGWHAVFVEGGGATVSSFLEAGLLDRLQVAIAPLVTGSGRPGIRLPERAAIADSLRPAHRVFTMGGDVLFDCDLRASAGTFPASALNRVL
jgi:riboflavin biosynthesis pyrimidine reductase